MSFKERIFCMCFKENTVIASENWSFKWLIMEQRRELPRLVSKHIILQSDVLKKRKSVESEEISKYKEWKVKTF